MSDVRQDDNRTKNSPQDSAEIACAKAWISVIGAIIVLAMQPSYQPIHPGMLFIPGVFGAIGLALGVGAFLRGTWKTKLVAFFAIGLHGVVVYINAYELYCLG